MWNVAAGRGRSASASAPRSAMPEYSHNGYIVNGYSVEPPRLFRRGSILPGKTSMRVRTPALLAAGALLLAGIASVRAAGPAAAPGPSADYAPVQAIFTAKCVRCHGPEKQKNGLRLDTRGAALEGGVDGAVITPGQSAQSKLVRQLLGEAKPRMPYKEPPLEPAEIAAIRAWIDAGAPGPADAKAEAKADVKPDAKAEPAAPKHWAYVKPVRP